MEFMLIIPPHEKIAKPLEDKLPVISIEGKLDENVKTDGTPEKSKSTTENATSIVTVCAAEVKPELASKITLSVAVGIDPIAAPPLVADQLLGSDQLPLPPIQK